MSEWNNKLDESEKKEFFCTGWGIVDGIIYCVRKAKEYIHNKRQSKNTG